MNPKDEDTTQMNLRIDRHLHRRIKAAAALEGVSMQTLIEGILRKVIEEGDDEEPTREDKLGKR